MFNEVLKFENRIIILKFHHSDIWTEKLNSYDYEVLSFLPSSRYTQFGPLQNNGDLRMHYKIRRSADYGKYGTVDRHRY